MSNNQLTQTRDNMQVSTFADGAATFLPKSMTEVLELGNIMCKADLALPKFLRGNQGACIAISMQAFRWGLDPFSVANKCYSVNDRIAYESQLIASVVNTRAPLQKRLVVSYEGKDGTRKCIVSGTFLGEDELRSVSSPPFNAITTKNSPLWKSDPDQQLYYYTVRVWARRYVPELLMGVYEVDEFEGSHRGPENARDVTPERPVKKDFEEPEFILWDNTGVEVETFTNQGAYLDALCAGLTEMANLEDFISMETIWENNKPELDNMTDDNRATIHAFYAELSDVSQTKDKPEPEASTKSETSEDLSTGESGEHPDHKFRLMRPQGMVLDCDNIQQWHDKILGDLGNIKTIDGVEKFRQRHGTTFMNLDADFHNEVTMVGKAIDERLKTLKNE